jgi:hypothetical protein
MGDTGMTPTSKSSMAASAAATKTSGRQFETLKIELPANFREFAKEVMALTRGNYEQIETAANEAMRVLVTTQSAAAKSILDYRAWLMKVAHGNVIAAFDFAHNLATAKSVPEIIEHSRVHAHVRFEALAAQSTELAEIAHNVATQNAEPIKTSTASAAGNAA